MLFSLTIYTRSVVTFMEDIFAFSYSVGLIPTKQNLSLTEKVTASAFCRYICPFLA